MGRIVDWEFRMRNSTGISAAQGFGILGHNSRCSRSGFGISDVGKSSPGDPGNLIPDRVGWS